MLYPEAFKIVEDDSFSSAKNWLALLIALCQNECADFGLIDDVLVGDN